MNAPVAFCPQCKNEVAFLTEGDTRRCPQCGYRYEIGKPVPPYYPPSDTIGFFGIFLRFVLIVIALVAVLFGIIFIGCITNFRM